jgi:hypothetical protein
MVANDLVGDWPMPQLWRGWDNTYLFCDHPTEARQRVFLVDETASPWTATLQETWDWKDWTAHIGGLPYYIKQGGQFHTMDFGSTWMAFNGQATLLKVPAYSSKLFQFDTTNHLTINTGMAFKEGRAFFGGFNAADTFALADWPTFLSGYHGDVPAHIKDLVTMTGMGPNWVWWSTIGGGDLLWLFSLDAMIYGHHTARTTGFDADNPYIRTLWLMNQSGARPMPWRGMVQKMMSIGPTGHESVVVYGADGVSALVPHTVGDTHTFGLWDIAGMGDGIGVGSNARGAAGGDFEAHLMLSEEGSLYVITADLKAQKLDYREWFDDWSDSSKIVIAKDPLEKEFYISNEDETFILTEHGIRPALTKGKYRPTSVCITAGGRVGMIETATDVPGVTTGAFDGGETGLWILSEVRVKSRTDTNKTLRVLVYYRMSASADWTLSAVYTPDNRGVVEPNLPGWEFKVRVYAPGLVGSEVEADVEGIQATLSREGEAKRRIQSWLTA